jgi:hypothetical protein
MLWTILGRRFGSWAVPLLLVEGIIISANMPHCTDTDQCRQGKRGSPVGDSIPSFDRMHHHPPSQLAFK